MKIRMLFLAMFPCLMALGCGVEEAEPADNGLRGEQVEPCAPEDCIPLSPQLGDACPEGTEMQNGAECVDSNGECVWEFWEECVEIGDPPPPPPPEEVPHPSDGPHRPIAHAG
jgi:hypothetical protein